MLPQLSIPIYEIIALEKRMTAFVIPNAIQITTRQAKYTFASFLSRDTTYDVIANIWRSARPDDVFPGSHAGSSGGIVSPASTSDVSGPVVTDGGKEAAPLYHVNKVTHCACSKNEGHLSEIALETVLPGTPDKIYNLIFASGFIKDFMRVDQKLMGKRHFGFLGCLPIYCLSRRPDIGLVSYGRELEAAGAEHVVYQAFEQQRWPKADKMRDPRRGCILRF